MRLPHRDQASGGVSFNDVAAMKNRVEQFEQRASGDLYARAPARLLLPRPKARS